MGDGKSRIDLEVNGLSEFVTSSNEVLDNFTEIEKASKNISDNIIDTNAQMQKLGLMPGGRSQTPSGGAALYTSTERDFEKRYKTDHQKWMREDIKARNLVFRTIGGATTGMGGGLLSLASGGGLTGFAKSFGGEMQKAIKGSGFTSLIADAFAIKGFSSLGRSAGGGGAARGAAGAASAVEGAELGGAVESSVATGLGVAAAGTAASAGIGVVPAIAAGVLATTAALALAKATPDKWSKDLVGRSRRAEGYGANLGNLTAFDDTMSRYVNPDNIMSAMRDAKYDMSSGAYQAMRIAGFDPKNYKDPTEMGEAVITGIQGKLQALNKKDPQTMLTMAHAMGYGNLGFSDDDLVRLATGSKSDVSDMVKKAKDNQATLGFSKDQIKANTDFVTALNLSTDNLKAFAERGNTLWLPALTGFTDAINAGTKAVQGFGQDKPWWEKLHDFFSPPAQPAPLSSDEGSIVGGILGASKKPIKKPQSWGDWIESFFVSSAKADEINLNQKLNAGGDKGTFGDLPIPPSLFDKMASSGKHLPVEDTALLDWFKTTFGVDGAQLGVVPSASGGGAPGYGEPGGPPQIYHSGGMGGAGEPRPLARGGGVGSPYGGPPVHEGKTPIPSGGGKGRKGTGGGDQRIAESMRILQAEGLSRKEAASLTGQMWAESNIMALPAHWDVSHFSKGTAQWSAGGGRANENRFGPLAEWAKSQGLNPETYQGQVAMAGHEWITQFRKKYGPGIDAAQTVEGITAGSDVFERYAGWKSGPRAKAIAGAKRAFELEHGITSLHMPRRPETPTPFPDIKITPDMLREKQQFDAPHRPVSPSHLGNIAHFQQDKSIKVNVTNTAGANIFVASGMLGNTSGGYGMT